MLTSDSTATDGQTSSPDEKFREAAQRHQLCERQSDKDAAAADLEQAHLAREALREGGVPPVYALCRVNGMKAGTMFVPRDLLEERRLREQQAIRDLTEVELLLWENQQEV